MLDNHMITFMITIKDIKGRKNFKKKEGLDKIKVFPNLMEELH